MAGNTRKRECALRFLRVAVLPLVVMMAPHAVLASFVGAYDPINWSFGNTAGGDGSVDTSGTPILVSIQGGNNEASGNLTQYTIAAAGTGAWSFDWSYDRFDYDPGYDFGGYILNGVFTSLADDDDAGTFSVDVNFGDIIGFGVECSDCAFGPGRLNITGLTAPQSPEPTSLVMMAFGVVGILLARLRRRTKRD